MAGPILRLAGLADIPKIKNFINTNWKRYNLINNEALFQHYFVDGETVNFVLSEDENGRLYGTLAFIRCGTREQPDLGATLFKTIDSPYMMLGVRLYRALQELTGHRTCFSQNMVPNTAELHRMMGHTVAEFEHWYRLSERNTYRVAVIREKRILPVKNGIYELVLFPDADELFCYFSPSTELVPYKDESYLRKRYFKYPAYRYDVYGLRDKRNGKIRSILVGREVAVEQERVLKIVDFVGDDQEFAQLSGEIQRLMDEKGYEYVEMYQYGLPADTMESAGFTRRIKGDSNIIPTYLEPLAQINTNYMLFYSDHADNIRIFKADCDMDRPNLEE